jgi:hypothetical protein
METSELLKSAWAAVEDAGLPDEVQAIGFREAVRLLAPESPGMTPTRRDAAGGRGERGGAMSDPTSDAPRITVSEDEIYDRVVEHTGVDRARLEQIVHLDDDGLRVSLPGLRLGRNNAERTRAVAQILTISRGFGLEEAETSLEVIRSECTRLKVYDSANFSSHVAKLSGYVVSGSGHNRRLRAKSPGIKAFPVLVDALAGEA